MDFALWELAETGDPQDEIAALIRLNPAVPLPSGVRIVSVFGDVVTCRLSRNAILDTWSDESVASFKAPRLLLPEDEVAPEDLPFLPEQDGIGHTTAILPTDTRRPPDIEETGKNIILGFIDWGLDFAHPDFLTPDGDTRLLALWDQRTVPGKSSPQPYGYGTVLSPDEINRALKTKNPYKTLGYYPADADPNNDGSHATHVTGIATGNGLGGGPVGIAPNAKIIFVHMSTLNSPGQEKLGDSVSLAEAVHFILEMAGDTPCVISLSMGRHGEQHDGTTLIEQAFDNLLNEKPGRAIVQSSGNYFNRKIHTSGRIRPGESVEFDWVVPVSDETPNQLEVWYSGRDILEIEVVSPDEKIRCQASLGKNENLLLNGQTVGRIYHRKLEPNNHDNHITVYLYGHAPTGVWKVILMAGDVTDGRFNAWIERDWGASKNQSTFHKEDAIGSCTTGTICNGCRTIAVGAYNPHSHQLEMGSFSSAGPTRDGRLKPDIAAPGVYILSARSALRNDCSPTRDLYTRKSGTSMAAPHVAATVALMFEAAKRPLHIEETHKLLLGSTQWDSDMESLQYRFGSGYLDIENAVAAARQISAQGKEKIMDRNRLFVTAQGIQPTLPREQQEETRAVALLSKEDTELETQLEKSTTNHSQFEKNGEQNVFNLEVGQEKRLLLKPDWDTDSRWSYTLSGESDSVLVSLEDLQLPPGLSDEPGVYQLMTLTALTPGKAKIILTRQEKGKEPSSKKTFTIQVGPADSSEPAPAKSLFATAQTRSKEEDWEYNEPESSDESWEPWISRESSATSTLIETLTQRIEALEASLAASEPYETIPAETVIGWGEQAYPIPSRSITEIADSLIEQGAAEGDSETLVQKTLFEANLPGRFPSPVELFDAYSENRMGEFSDQLEVVGLPGKPLIQPLREGDILVRRALGEGTLGHAAFINTPALFSKEQLLEEGLTPESLSPGWYAHVVEGGFLPHNREQGYARRVLDWNGRVMDGQLVVRPLTEAASISQGNLDYMQWVKAPLNQLLGYVAPINRNSKDYIKWVQASLNKILGLSLIVDGVAGSKTRQAVMTFQWAKELPADGVVGTRTEQALVNAGAPMPPRASGAPGGSVAASLKIPSDWQARCQGKETLLERFDYDKSNLKSDHQNILDGLAQQIVQSQKSGTPVTAVCLVGHTDHTGNDDYNFKLGQNRADSALKALVATIEKLQPGLSGKIEIRSFSLGKTVPIGDEKTDAGRAQNRRVAIFLTQTAKPKPKPGVCFAPPVSKEDPTTLVVAAAGQKDFDAGTATLLGEKFKIFGRVFYPAESAGKDKPFNKKLAAQGTVPIVFIVHGNHGIFSNPKKRTEEVCTDPGGFIPIPNHLGYIYFQEMLAKMGIISVSVNCNETNCQGGSPTNIRQRAGLILAAMKHFHGKHTGGDPIFGGRINFGKTGLVGHSRGAEAVLVVPELLGTRIAGLEDILIQSVISLAPTDNAASNGIPNGYALLVILPAGDGDVITNDGAKYYDQCVPSPYKTQLYIHHANHNFFNREWVLDESMGPPVLNNAQHERFLSVYGAAFFRDTLLGQQAFRRFLRNDELPPATSTVDVHISYEEKGPITVDDYQNRNIALNALSQPTSQSGGLTAAEFDFSQTGSAVFNGSFYGNTVGMVSQTSVAGGLFKSQLGSAMDLTNKEVWIRAAEVYDGTSVPATATGFQLGLEDTSGNVALVDSDNIAGGLPRPYDRRDADLKSKRHHDFTKTMLKTFRFPANCFTNNVPGFDLTKVIAIHIQMNRNDQRALAFDQLQIV
jgi:outer membrane protein OmpA-like peptidoglycan-associated protein